MLLLDLSKVIHTLNQEEEQLILSFENGEWQTVENIHQETKRALEAAKNYLQITREVK